MPQGEFGVSARQDSWALIDIQRCHGIVILGKKESICCTTRFG